MGISLHLQLVTPLAPEEEPSVPRTGDLVGPSVGLGALVKRKTFYRCSESKYDSSVVKLVA